MFEQPAVPSTAARDIPAGAFIVDVREPDEWSQGHIEGSLHMPMQSVPHRLAELPTDRQLTILCAVGGRSAQVTTWLAQQGYDAINAAGGIFEWIDAGRPIVSGPQA